MEAYRAAGAEARAACPMHVPRDSIESLLSLRTHRTTLADARARLTSLGRAVSTPRSPHPLFPFSSPRLATTCSCSSSIGLSLRIVGHLTTARSKRPRYSDWSVASRQSARGMVAVSTAAMASSFLLRPRASFRRALPPPPPSSRRALPAPRVQAASTQQEQPGRPAGTRLYSLAPYPLLLAALLPGGT